jgi:hypothetical protein
MGMGVSPRGADFGSFRLRSRQAAQSKGSCPNLVTYYLFSLSEITLAGSFHSSGYSWETKGSATTSPWTSPT